MTHRGTPRATWRCLRNVALALATAAACGEPMSNGRLAGVELIPAKPKPAFTLTSTSGAKYDFRRETDGRVALLFFGYTHCPDVCPVHLANIAAAMKRLSRSERAGVRVVFVTTDPMRDSLARLRTWLNNFDSTFVGLRGSRDSVAAIESGLGLAPSEIEPGGSDGYGVGHAAEVLAFTPDDSLRALYSVGVRQEDWASDLPRLLAIGSKR